MNPSNVHPLNAGQRSQSPAVPKAYITAAELRRILSQSSPSAMVNNGQQQPLSLSNFRSVPQQMMSVGGQVTCIVNRTGLNPINRLQMNMHGVLGIRPTPTYQVQHAIRQPGGVPLVRMSSPTTILQQQPYRQSRPAILKGTMVTANGNSMTKKVSVMTTASLGSINAAAPPSETSSRAATNMPASSSAPTFKNLPMPLRSQQLPLHTMYFQNNEILDKDADVIFLCGDGGGVKAHRIILATQYKLLTTLFSDQAPGEISVVSVPDISSETMKLIVLLAYKSDVVVNADQIEKMKEFSKMFGIEFGNWTIGSNVNGKLDVQSGKVMEDIVWNTYGQRQKLVPSFTSQKLTNLQKTKGSNSGHGHRPRAAEDLLDSHSSSDGKQGFSYTPRNNDTINRRKSNLPSKIHPQIEASDSSENDVTLLEDTVGKPEPSAKRPRVDTKFQCRTCNTTFFNESAWKWHQDRHAGHGIFKCSLCGEIKTTARTIWNHESIEHNFVGLLLSQVSPITSEERSRKLLLQRKLKLGVTGKDVSKLSTSMKVDEDSLDSGEFGSKKRKEIRWMYICAKCEHCSWSVYMAQMHFKECYSNTESLFESTVTKCRHGFYGQIKCPLCPRRYTSNIGWVLHVARQHKEFRQLVASTGMKDKKLKCLNCNKRYESPEEFRLHLHQGMKCIDDSMPVLTPSKRLSRAEASETADASTSSLPLSKIGQRKKLKLIAKPRHSRSAPPSPIMTPVAKHALGKFMAKVKKGNGQEDNDNEKSRRPAKRDSVVTAAVSGHQVPPAPKLPPAECPFCGELISNISKHLSIDHGDIDLSVMRISEEDLKCRRCRMTFGIPDLFAHAGNCHISSSSTSLETQNSGNNREEIVHEPVEIPVEVGSSPIDEMEYTLDELMTKKVLKKALKCPICKKLGVHMRDASVCLKQHGIFRCSLCFNTYSQREHFDQHLQKCHYDTRSRLKCLFCPGKTFTNIGNCVSHLHLHHWMKVLLQVPTSHKLMKKKISRIRKNLMMQPRKSKAQTYQQLSNTREETLVFARKSVVTPVFE